MIAQAVPAAGFILVLGASLGALFAYFVGSARAKQRVVDYEDKLRRIVQQLLSRRAEVDALLQETRRKADEGSRRAQHAEARAHRAEQDLSRSEDERRAAAADAEDQAARAVRAQAACKLLQNLLLSLSQQAARWSGELDVAARLGEVATMSLPRQVSTLRTVHRTSVLLGGVLPRPEQALEALDAELSKLASTDPPFRQALGEVRALLSDASDAEGADDEEN